MSQPQPPWTGWLRILPAGQWQPVVSGDTWEECMRRLLSICPRESADSAALAQMIEKIAQESHRHPDRRKRPR